MGRLYNYLTLWLIQRFICYRSSFPFEIDQGLIQLLSTIWIYIKSTKIQNNLVSCSKWHQQIVFFSLWLIIRLLSDSKEKNMPLIFHGITQNCVFGPMVCPQVAHRSESRSKNWYVLTTIVQNLKNKVDKDQQYVRFVVSKLSLLSWVPLLPTWIGAW